MRNSKDIKKAQINAKVQKMLDDNNHTNTDLKLTYEEYKRLRRGY